MRMGVCRREDPFPFLSLPRELSISGATKNPGLKTNLSGPPIWSSDSPVSLDSESLQMTVVGNEMEHKLLELLEGIFRKFKDEQTAKKNPFGLSFPLFCFFHRLWHYGCNSNIHFRRTKWQSTAKHATRSLGPLCFVKLSCHAWTATSGFLLHEKINLYVFQLLLFWVFCYCSKT